MQPIKFDAIGSVGTILDDAIICSRLNINDKLRNYIIESILDNVVFSVRISVRSNIKP